MTLNDNETLLQINPYNPTNPSEFILIRVWVENLEYKLQEGWSLVVY